MSFERPDRSVVSTEMVPAPLCRREEKPAWRQAPDGLNSAISDHLVIRQSAVQPVQRGERRQLEELARLGAVLEHQKGRLG